MNIRNETAKSTIPAGITQSGTLTSAGTNHNFLRRSQATIWVSAAAVSAGVLKVWLGQVWKNLTGTNTATEPQNDRTNWERYTPDRRSYIWIYLPDNGAGAQDVAYVESISATIDVENSTYNEVWCMDRSIQTTGAVAWQLVVGNLPSYSVDNNGGADGDLEGETFKNGQILDRVEPHLFKTGYQEVAYIDATGTNFYIIEG